MGDQISERSARRSIDIQAVAARLEPVIVRLRQRATHCRGLAERANLKEASKELLGIARECEADADQLEAMLLFVIE